MKQKSILWLSLLTVFTLILYSCRNDHFPEQEKYNNSSLFKLTSKRISLNQSKHKSRLLPELKKAEAEFKAKTKSIAFGKTVHYGDGVSINTDDVIYIENGANYYTYTFKIERDNAPANAPVENLVLSPLSDGTWREMLITYNLTEQEKQTMNAGGAVDLTGKVGYTQLQSGTYSSGIMQKTDNSNCYWVVDYYFTTCSEGVHNHGELADDNGGVCEAEVQSVIVINSAEYVCPNPGGSDPGTIYNPGNTPYPQTGSNTGTEGGATTAGGGTGTVTQPCDGNGVPTQPLDPSNTIGTQNNCNTGTPTLPNLPLSNPEDITPCNKLTNLFDPTKGNLKPLIINGMYNYIDNSVGEAGIYIRKTAAGVVTTEVAPPTGNNSLPGKWGTSYYSQVHTHPKDAYPMFSYSDMMVLYNLETQAYSYNTGYSSMILVCEDDNGVKQTYAIVFENTGQLVEDVWGNPENIGCSTAEIVKKMDEKLKDIYDLESEKISPNYERAFLQFNFGTNIGLYKANSTLSGWSKLSINENSSTAAVISTNCN